MSTEEVSSVVQDGVPEHRAGSSQPLDQWPTGRLVSAVARRIEREWNAHLDDWDLSHASLPVLYVLAGGPRSQRELAQACGVTQQTMSRVVARLERCDYVARTRHGRDRRRHEVVLTESGRLALAEAGDRAVAEEMTVRGLTAEQVAQLRELLTAMLLAHSAPDALPEHVSTGHPPTGPAPDEPARRQG